VKTILKLVLCFFCLPVWATHTCSVCYVSAGGSDSNSGATKLLSWAHLPGSPLATGNAASQVPVAGDSYIFKGGDTWTNANFPITWSWSGGAGNVITIGVDKTWYTGGSWVRPVWDAGGVAISPKNVFMYMSSVNYVTVGDLEMTGIYWTGVGTYAQLGSISEYGSDYLTYENLYIHNWTHAVGGGTTDANLMMILGQTTSPWCGHCLLTGSTIQNADGGGDSGYATYAWGGSVTNNVIHDVPNGVLEEDAGTSAQIAGNLIYNIATSFSSTHENAIETIGGTTTTIYIHDNVIGPNIVVESLMIGNTGETAYVWNNIFNTLGSTVNSPTFPQTTGQTGMSIYFWNNTVAPAAGYTCFAWVGGFGGTYNTIAIQNNHCITTNATLINIGFSVSTYTTGNNLLQTPTAATAQGYTSSSTYAYSPIGVTGSTCGAGTNLTSSWPAGYSTSDTSYANTRTQLTRPVLGTIWDVGAYDCATGIPTAPGNSLM
jgi:hypothetical protein